MKFAYSILTNDYIFADSADYDDTANLQIRCPFCFEPVFLKKGNSNVTHFSHYPESMNGEICELRSVASSYSSYSNYESETKGQTLLKHYLMFSKCYASYMGIPENLFFSSNIGTCNFHLMIENKIQDDNSDLATELKLPHMSAFRNSSIDIFLNAIQKENLKFPDDSILYSLFNQSISDFLTEFNKHDFDFNLKGLELLREKLSFNDGSSFSLRTMIVDNIDVICSKLLQKFTYLEIQSIINCLLVTQDSKVNIYLEKIKKSVEEKCRFWMVGMDGKRSGHLEVTKTIKYLYGYNFFKVTLFLGQQNVVWVEDGTKITGKLILINPNIDFLERLVYIDVFSVHKTSLFYKYFPGYFFNSYPIIHAKKVHDIKRKYLNEIKNMQFIPYEIPVLKQEKKIQKTSKIYSIEKKQAKHTKLTYKFCLKGKIIEIDSQMLELLICRKLDLKEYSSSSASLYAKRIMKGLSVMQNGKAILTPKDIPIEYEKYINENQGLI